MTGARFRADHVPGIDVGGRFEGLGHAESRVHQLLGRIYLIKAAHIGNGNRCPPDRDKDRDVRAGIGLRAGRWIRADDETDRHGVAGLRGRSDHEPFPLELQGRFELREPDDLGDGHGAATIGHEEGDGAPLLLEFARLGVLVEHGVDRACIGLALGHDLEALGLDDAPSLRELQTNDTLDRNGPPRLVAVRKDLREEERDHCDQRDQECDHQCHGRSRAARRAGADRCGRGRHDTRAGHRDRRIADGGDCRGRGTADHGLAAPEAQEVAPQIVGRLIPISRVLGQAGEDDRFELVRNAGPALGRRNHRLAHVQDRDRHRAVADEGHRRRHHLVQHNPQRIDVRSWVDRCSLRLLGGEIRGRPHDRAGAGEPVAGAVRARDAEVCDLDLAGWSDEHVAGLDISMDHPGPVRGGQCLRNVGCDLRGAVGRDRALVDDLAQRAPLDVLHHDERRGLFLAPVVHRDDGGVVETGRGLGFEAEAFDKGRVPGELDREDLQRDRPVELGVPSEIHVGHATASDLTDDLVAVGVNGWISHGLDSRYLGR